MYNSLSNIFTLLRGGKITLGKHLSDVGKEAVTLKGNFKNLLKVAAPTALAAVGVGIALWASHMQKVKQEAAEMRQQIMNAGDAASDEVKNINDLYDNYEAAKDAYENNAGSKEDLEAATNELLSALGEEEGHIDTLIAQYGSLDAAINQLTIDKLRDKLTDITAAYEAAQEEFLSAADDADGWTSGRIRTFDGSGDNAKFRQVLQDQGYLQEGQNYIYGVNHQYGFDYAKERYQELLDMRAALEEGIDSGLYSRDDMVSSDVYKVINTEIGKVSEEWDKIQGYISDANTVQSELLWRTQTMSGEVPKTKEEYLQFRDAMLQAALSSNDFLGSQEDITNAVDSVITKMTGFTMEAENYKAEMESVFGQDLTEFVSDLSDEDISILYGVYQSKDADAWTFDDLINTYNETKAQLEATSFDVPINLEFEKEGFDQVSTALSESLSLTGLQSESISALKTRYQDLENYDAGKLFEKTASGVKLNTTAMRELEDAYRKQKKAEAVSQLDDLIKQYQDLDIAIRNTSDVSKRTDLINQRTGLQQQISDTSELIAQYDGLTSAFKRWQDAQSGPKNRDTYEGVIQGFEDVDDLISRGWVDDEVRAFVDAMSFKDLSTAGYDEIISEWDALNTTIEGTTYKVRDFFTKNEEGQSTTTGLYNFFDALVQKGNEVGKTFAYIDEQGGYHIDTGLDDAEVAELLNMDVESVQHILEAMRDAGWDIDLSSILDEVDNLGSQFEQMGRQANNALQEIGATDISFDFDTNNIEDLNKQISQAQDIYNSMLDEDGEIKVGFNEEDLENASTVIGTLVAKKQSLDDAAVLKVDVSQADSEIAGVIAKLQAFKQAQNNYEAAVAVGADTTQAEADVQAALADISNSDAEILAQLNIDPTSAETALASINALDMQTIISLVPDATLVDEYVASTQQGQGVITWSNNTSLVDSYSRSTKAGRGVVTWSNNEKAVKKSFTATGTVIWRNAGYSPTTTRDYPAGTTGSERKTGAQGTAYANGSGNWGLPDSGIGLGGEVGPEIRVRDGHWELIGAESAEFFDYERGDIIFNAEQTRQILANGKIQNGKKRGVVYAQGSAFSTGSGPGPSKVPSHSTLGDNTGSSGSSSSSGKSYTGNGADDTEDTVEKIDWIEVAIDRLERAISQLDITAKSTFKNLSNRTTAAYDEMLAISQEIELQNEAVQRYYAEAQSIGLSEDIAKLVRDGTIDINQYDEDTRDLIDQYQEWYEKMLDCADAVAELRENLAQLYEDNFTNIQTKFDNDIALLEHLTNTFNTGIDALEAQGYMESKVYYEALSDVEQQKIETLNQQYAELFRAFSEAMNSGEIEEGSESW